VWQRTKGFYSRRITLTLLKGGDNLNIKHESFKPILAIVLFVISVGLVIHFLTSFVDELYLKVIVGCVSFVLDAIAVYCLGIGKYHFKNRQYLRATHYITFYMIYVLIFGTLSAVGFFVNKFDIKETSANNIKLEENIYRSRLKEIDSQVKTLNVSLNKESETGYGKRSETIVKQVEKLNLEREKLINNISELSKTETKHFKNIVSSVSKFTGIPERTLALLVFSTGMMFPTCAAVFSLYCLTNSMIWMPY
jgi:hypothetical protein